MSFPGVGLTAISGGINRLRTKGGADKNSLFDLLNGYVTQAGTVKVREGTSRKANIATYSGVGTTKGLLAYQGNLHVFSNQVVSVPAGFELHVLNHPASIQLGTVNTPAALNVSLSSTGANARIGANANFGNVTASSANWFAKEALVTPDPGHDIGSGAIGGATIGGFTVAAFFQADGTSPGDPNHVYLVLNGAFNLVGASIAFLDLAGTTTVTVPLDVAHQTTALGLGASFTVFDLGTDAYNMGIFGGHPFTQTTATTQTVAIVPLAIQEINFAAPYLGGIYVVATFVITDPTVLAQYGATYHFWIQSSTGGDNSNEWVASTDYLAGTVVIPTAPNGLTYVASRRLPPNPIWTANTAEVVGNIVEPVTPNGFQFTATATLGANPTTGATEPTWPTTDGAIVNENSSSASDQTVTLATPANATPPTAPPSKYSGGIAGGFGS